MNWKTTFVLLVIAAALVAYFKLYDEKQLSTADAERLKERPIVVDRSQVDGLTITNHDLKIDLRRDATGEWDMKSPIADRADKALVDQIMTALETMHKEGNIPGSEVASNKSKLQEYGLQSPRLRLQVTPRGGSPTSELIFGNDTVIEGKTYMQVSGHNDVYVIGSEIKKLLDKDVNAWRDHRLTELAATDVNKLTVKNSAGELEVQRQGEHWQITKPLNARASDQKANDLVSQLTNLTISSFVADDKADAATYGLADPRGVVTLYTAKDPKGTELIIGSPKAAAAPDKNNPAAAAVPAASSTGDGSVYLRMPARQSIYTVPGSVENFLSLKPNDLRDRQLVRLNTDMVDRIRMTPANGGVIALARKDKEWTLLGPPADQPANPAEADKLMQTLGQATVSAFVADSASDLAKYGLDKPQLKVSFSAFASENTAESNAGEKPLATISFGKTEDANVYVRVEEEPFILSVPRSVLEAIPLDRTLWQPLNIFQANPEKISSVSISAQGQAEVSMTRADKGQWTLTKGTGPLDQAKAQSVANTLAKLRATRWIGGALPPESGLEPLPAFATIRFETAGDAKNSGVLMLGHTGAENMGYSRVEGRPGTFLVSRPDYDTLLQPLVPAPAATPTPTPEPTPAATPTPTPTPEPAPAATLAPTPTATPTVAPLETPAMTPTAAATPLVAATPLPSSVETPTPEPTAAPVVISPPPAATSTPTPIPTLPATEPASPMADAPATPAPTASPTP